ncbi:MAG TPA: hypothetical protein VFS66_09695 [Acidimicrobiia bacterium]|nr:hypothetical protein [Acidimicrobiia bacterium]
MSDSLQLRLDLIPLTIGNRCVVDRISIAVVLLRRTNATSGSQADPSITMWLTLVVALCLIGALFLFMGLYE